jgi:DNA-binding NarL/FixJ family response regulator
VGEKFADKQQTVMRRLRGPNLVPRRRGHGHRPNGFDATREIVRSSPEIPVVITTLYEYPEILRQAQISGAQG